MKCPNCDKETLDLATTSQPVDSELKEWDYLCRNCQWHGVESQTIRTPREIASAWLFQYIVSVQHLDSDPFVNECWSDEETEQHIDFVELCFSKGIKPTHFVDKMIADYRAYLDLAVGGE